MNPSPSRVLDEFKNNNHKPTSDLNRRFRGLGLQDTMDVRLEIRSVLTGVCRARLEGQGIHLVQLGMTIVGRVCFYVRVDHERTLRPYLKKKQK